MHSMKFKRLLLLLVFAALPTFAYQQQWFSQFQALDGNMNFTCTGQCIAVIGPLAGSDYISLNGTVKGNGMIGYGFLVGQQIIPWDTLQVNGDASVNQQFSFSKLPFYSQIPAEAQVVFIVQGTLTWTQFGLKMWAMSFYQKIGQWWKDFWQNETLTPYSINLRYGVKLLGTSIIQYGYRLFAIIALLILFFAKWNKKEKYRRIFFLGFGMFLFIGIRNLITYTWIVNQGLNTFTNQSPDNRTFFDLWDYIAFTDKIRKELKLDESQKICNIYIDSFQDRPFKAHRDTLYIKPCIGVLTSSEADYIIYYKKPLATWDIQKTVLVDFNGSYLLQNK